MAPRMHDGKSSSGLGGSHTKWKLYDCWMSFWIMGLRGSFLSNSLRNVERRPGGPHLKGAHRVCGGKFEQ